MAKHIQNVAEMKTLIETKKLTNDGLLSLGNYKENSAVSRGVAMGGVWLWEGCGYGRVWLWEGCGYGGNGYGRSCLLC